MNPVDSSVSEAIWLTGLAAAAAMAALLRSLREQALLRQQVALWHNLYTRSRYLAMTDGMTGLFNFRAFEESLEQEMALARKAYYPVSLILFDLDDFKLVNDLLGHPTGDQALRRTARILQGSARGDDVVARYGGEEFVVLLRNTSRDEAMRAAERIRRQIEMSFQMTPVGPLKVTVSGGVATFPQDATNPKSLLEAADQALLEAKRTGKNRINTRPVFLKKAA